MEDVEDVRRYAPGGYHPVNIDESFDDGRYVVLHKLGHGGFATVWLARDNTTQQLVALKILTSKDSGDVHELKIYQHLETIKRTENARPSTPRLIHHFEIKGPNGSHVCLALPFLGPSLSTFQQDGQTRKIRPDVARKMSHELAKSILTLHNAGIIIGGELSF
jgi:serine/threonine-protein kinase SRPK3